MLSLRYATINDSEFVAWAVLVAVGIDQPDADLLSKVSEMCRRTDVLYSWKNSLIAESNGNPVGSLTCYDGSGYQAMREITFPIIAQNTGNDFSSMEMETGPGEFYLDSMAVLPECRKQGFATSLLKAGVERARELCIPRVAMVVSPEKPEAQRLYEFLGFRFERDMFLFGEDYRKMVKILRDEEMKR